MCPRETLLSLIKEKYFFDFLESLRFYNVYEWKKSKIKMYLEKHLTKIVWSNDLRDKVRLLLTVLKNILLITHFSICDLLLSWACLPTYLRQRQDKSNQNINSPRDWCRISLKFGKRHVIHQFNQSFMSTTKVNLGSTNFVISHVEREEWILLWLDRMHQEIGLWLLQMLQKIRAWKVDEKWAHCLDLYTSYGP